MDEACMNAIIGTLLIVDSFVEADDLQDAFERHRLGPVVHMRTVETARAMLEETARRPQILVIGAAAGSAMSDALIEEQQARGAKILVLSDGQSDGAAPGVIHLARPYAESDLTRAIGQLLG